MSLRSNSPIFWFARQLRPFIGEHLLSISLLILSSLMFLVDPLIIKWLIDHVLPTKDARSLMLAASVFFLVYVGRLSFSGLGAFVYSRTMQHLAFRIRLQIVEQMNRLSADYHETTPVGHRLYRIEQDVDQVAELGSSVVPYALQAAFNTTFVVGTMFVLDFRLTCMILPLMPVFFLFRKYFEGRLRGASDEAQHQSTLESSLLEEHLASIVQVQLLHQEQNQKKAFVEQGTAKLEAINHRTLVEILFSTSYMAVVSLGTIVILGYGGAQVFAGALTIGGLVAFYSYMARLFDPLHAAVEIYSRLNRLNTSLLRILEVIEMTPNVTERPAALPLPSPIRGFIEMRQVSFSYSTRQPVLHNFDLKLEAGIKVGLVGASGSGKSTVAKLLARMYDVNSGAVYIDGIDIRDLVLGSLRTKVCYVMQDAVLFNRTLKENLLLGNPAATMQDLCRAIEIAGLDELLQRAPNVWDSPLGPRGKALSGGERQRVALARAVLQNPSLLLLDESTSALDAPSERGVLTNLAEHFRHQTVVFISHRISSLSWVDRMVVVNQGVIEEQGTHPQLIRSGGLYAHLHNAPAVAATD